MKPKELLSLLAGSALGVVPALLAWFNWKRRESAPEPHWALLKENLWMPLFQGFLFDDVILLFLIIILVPVIYVAVPWAALINAVAGFGLAYAGILLALVWNWEKKHRRKFEVRYYERLSEDAIR